jgi:hypothetical protein
MAELDTVRDFRAGLPERNDLARARVRHLLLHAIERDQAATTEAPAASERRHGGRLLGRPLVLIAAAVVAVVAASTALAWHSLTSIILGERPSPAVEKGFVLTGQTRKAVMGRLSGQGNLELSKIFGAVRIQTAAGPVAIWVAPTRRGGFCALLDFEKDRTPTGLANGGAFCEPVAEPQQHLMYSLSETLVKGSYVRLLTGHVRAPVVRLELEFPDGSKVDLPLSRGFFIYDASTRMPARMFAWGQGNRLIREVTLHAPAFMTHS